VVSIEITRRYPKVKDIAYVLFNPSMPTLSRVGLMAGRTPSELMEEFYSENVPLPYECVYACKVKDGAQAERAVFEKFGAEQIGRYGDFDDVKPERLVEVLRPYETEDITASFRESFDSTLTDEEKEARANYTARRRAGRDKR
jgi:hypothetical protein